MSIHSCNKFCDLDIRLHSFQKGHRNLELGYPNESEDIIKQIDEDLIELKELKVLLTSSQSN